MNNSLGSLSSLRSRLILASLVAAVALVALPTGASAGGSFTVDIKAHPSAFKSGKQVDLPVYLVENRAANRDPMSWFSEYPLGLRHVGFDFTSSQSQFVSFKPVPRLDYRGKYYYNETAAKTKFGQSHVWLALYSTVGLTAKPDNTGITGRTEIKLGMLKVKVGAPIGKGPGKLVFEADLLGDPSFGSGGGVGLWTKLGTKGDITGGGTTGTGGLERKRIRVHSDDGSSAGMAPGDGVKSSPKKIKPGKKAKLKLKCSIDCQLSPTLKIGKKKVKGLKDLKVKAGATSASFGLPAKVNSKVKAAVKKGTKVTLTLTPESADGYGKPVTIQIR